MSNQEAYEIMCHKAERYDQIVNVLNKIKIEVELSRRDEPDCSDLQFNDGLDEALQIIDKYRMEVINDV